MPVTRVCNRLIGTRDIGKPITRGGVGDPVSEISIDDRQPVMTAIIGRERVL